MTQERETGIHGAAKNERGVPIPSHYATQCSHEEAADPQAIEAIFDALGKPRESNIYNVPEYIRRLTARLEQAERGIEQLWQHEQALNNEAHRLRARLEQAVKGFRRLGVPEEHIEAWLNSKPANVVLAPYITRAALSPDDVWKPSTDGTGFEVHASAPAPRREERCPTCRTSGSGRLTLDGGDCTDPWHTKDKT